MHVSLVLIMWWMGFTPATNQTISLEKALQSRVVKLSAKGNSASTHYGLPLQVQISNVSKNPIQISAAAGLVFQPEDSLVQGIMLTTEQLIALKPGEQKTLMLHGMCINPQNRAPRSEDVYVFGGKAPAQLSEIADFINQNKMQNVTGQRAVWLICNKSPLHSIISDNSEEERQLMRKIAAIRGETPLSDEACKQRAETGVYTSTHIKITGSFGFRVAIASDVHIALFDENGIVLKEIYRDNAQPGKHNVSYQFDATPHLGHKVYARLVSRHQLMIERKFEL